MNIPSMKPEVVLALAKMLTEKVVSDARDLVGDGHAYDVEATIHVRGTVSVGEATMTKQVNRLNPYILMQVALSKLNGVSVESFVAEVMALQAKNVDGKESAEFLAIKASVSSAMEKLTAGVTQRRRGGVSFEGEIVVAGDRVAAQPSA
jgi:hypothetical protein